MSIIIINIRFISPENEILSGCYGFNSYFRNKLAIIIYSDGNKSRKKRIFKVTSGEIHCVIPIYLLCKDQ